MKALKELLENKLAYQSKMYVWPNDFKRALELKAQNIVTGKMDTVHTLKNAPRALFHLFDIIIELESTDGFNEDSEVYLSAIEYANQEFCNELQKQG